MSLLDDIKEEETSPGRNYSCSACDAIESLSDPKERAALADALAPGKLSERAILRISAKNDLKIGRSGILKHRQEGHTP